MNFLFQNFCHKENITSYTSVSAKSTPIRPIYSKIFNNSIWTIHLLHTFTAPMDDSSLFYPHWFSIWMFVLHATVGKCICFVKDVIFLSQRQNHQDIPSIDYIRSPDLYPSPPFFCPEKLSTPSLVVYPNIWG